MNSSLERIVIGLAGNDADVPLIRYAAMLTRIHAARPAAADRSDAITARGVVEHTDAGAIAVAAEPSVSGGFPEVRFVHVQSRSRAASPRGFRARLREQVQRYFPALPADVPVGCDVLTGHPVDRLATFAADFDSDLLLVGQALCPPPRCGRLVQASPCPVWLVPHDWPPLVRRILVPLDLCERHLPSLRRALELARLLPRAKVLPLHVHQEGVTIADAARYDDVQRRKRTQFEAFLRQVVPQDVELEPHLAVGLHIPRVIAAVAHQQSVDLIVLSTRGRSRLASHLLPSGAEQTIRLASTSILVCREDCPPLGVRGALAERLRTPDIRFS
jgi:nucleotide-binding universal stress UspA family protein